MAHLPAIATACIRLTDDRQARGHLAAFRHLPGTPSPADDAEMSCYEIAKMPPE